MSQRYRTSTTTATQRARAVIDLPPHQPPTHALDNEAQIALNKLKNSKKFEELKNHYIVATNCLTDAAGDVNERLNKREKREAKRKGRAGEEEEDDGGLEEFRERVDAETRKMEKSVRGVIDGQAGVQRMEDAVKWLAMHAVGESRLAEQTQRSAMGQSQRGQTQRARRRQARGEGEEEDEDEDEDMEDEEPDPTMPEGTAPLQLPSLMESFDKRFDEETEIWKAMDMKTRYAQNNNYVGFRRVVHEGLTKDGERTAPMPHHSTWFTEDGKPAANLTSKEIRNTGDDGEGDDSDIEVAGEVQSLKCPITLMPFKDPVTSKLCKHSFERAAILEMIRTSKAQKGGSTGRNPTGGQRCVQCPVASCDKMLSKEDLESDSFLLRKVSRARQQEEDDDEDDGEGPTIIKSSQGENIADSVEMEED